MEAPEWCIDIEANDLLTPNLSTIHCIVAGSTLTGELKVFHDKPAVGNRDGSTNDGIAWLATLPVWAAHNGLGYDLPALQYITKDWQTLKPECVFDTHPLGRIAFTDLGVRSGFPRKWYEIEPKLLTSHSLKAWGQRLANLKDDYTGGFETFTPAMLEYCKQDVRVLIDLVKLIAPLITEQVWREETEFAWLMFLQEKHGWRFNEQAAHALYTRLCEERDALRDELVPLGPITEVVGKKPSFYQIDDPAGGWYKADTKGELMASWRQWARPGDRRKDVEDRILEGPPNVTRIPWNPLSRTQLHDYLVSTYGWEPSVWKKGKNTIKRNVKPQHYQGLEADGFHPVLDDDVLKEMPYDEAPKLARLYTLQKRLGQLSEGNQGLLRHSHEGRIHGSVNSCGTATVRCTHSSPNLAQVPSVRADYGHDFRALFGAEPGHVLFGFDASALEMRGLASYLAYFDGGEYAAKVDDPEVDMHSYNQELAGLSSRDDAKTLYYALAYGAQDAKLGTIAGGGKKAGARLRSRFYENLTGLGDFMTFGEEAIKKGYLVFPDGRHVHIRSKHAWLNTLLQGTGGLIMKEACRRFVRKLREAGLRVFGLDCPWWDRRLINYDVALVGNIHDEVQASIRPEYVPVAGEASDQALLEAGEHYGMRCPIRGEWKQGGNWAETH